MKKTSVLGLAVLFCLTSSVSAVPITEDWAIPPNTHGGPWPAQWNINNPSGYTVTSVNPGTGRVNRPTGNGNSLIGVGWVTAAWADADVTVDFMGTGGGGAYPGIAVHVVDGSNYYWIGPRMGVNGARFYKTIGGVQTELGTTTLPYATDVWYTGRFQVSVAGGVATLRYKQWLQGGAEPGAWDAEMTDNDATLATASGGVGLVLLESVDRRMSYYDNFSADIPEPATLALLVLGGLALVSRKRRR